MPRSRRIAALVMLACLAGGGGLLGACTNPFAPRNPEPPSQGSLRTNYTEPDSTLGTMALAIEAKAGGNALSAYLGALADSIPDGQDFFAYFDGAAAARWQNVTGRQLPDVWGVDLEERFFNHLPSLSAQRAYDFAWLEDVEHPNDEDLASGQKLLHRQYLLLAVPEGLGAPDTLAIGFADLTFIKSRTADKWVISRWQDRVDPAAGANPANTSHLSFSARRLEVY